MNFLLRTLLIFSTFILYTEVPAQGVIVNEASNGPSGGKEFYELLVIGSNAQPTGNIDLTGFIIDDNNGDFGSGTGMGISAGHVRITGACLSSVPIGALIAIYNPSDPNPSLPADDPTDSNGDLTYVFPVSHSCFSRCTTAPTTSNANYTGCSYTSGVSTAWSQIALGNGDDAPQTRRPDGSFFHGFSYGDDTHAGPTFEFPFSSGSNRNFFLNCGNWFDAANFGSGTASSDDSPGVPNSPENTFLINEIRAGSFDYDNPAAFENCDNILPLTWLSLEAKTLETEILLMWKTSSETNHAFFSAEKSTDGISFKEVGKVHFPDRETENVRTYLFRDTEASSGKTYYRIRQNDLNGDFSYSPVCMAEGLSESSLWNIFTEGSNRVSLRIRQGNIGVFTLNIFSPDGRHLHREKFTAGIGSSHIKTSFSGSGIVIAVLRDEQGKSLRKKLFLY